MRATRGPWLGLFGRQVVRDTTLHIGIAVVAGLLLYIAIDTVETGNMAKNTEDALAVLRLELVTLPVVFQQFSGMAAVIGTATALAALIRRGEVVAMLSAGGPPSLLLKPLMLAALLWALAYGAITEWVAPWSHAEIVRLRRSLGIGKHHGARLRGSRSWFTGKDRIFRVGDLVDAKGEQLASVLILSLEEGRLVERWDVARLTWDGAGWTAHEVTRRRWPTKDQLETERLRKTALDLPETPEDFVRSVGAPERMTMAALRSAVAARARLGQPTEAHRIELYRRWTRPITLWLAALVAAGLMLRAGRRPTVATALGYGAGGGFSLWLVDELGVALASTGALSVPSAASLAPVMTGAAALGLWVVAYRRGITD